MRGIQRKFVSKENSKIQKGPSGFILKKNKNPDFRRILGDLSPKNPNFRRIQPDLSPKKFQNSRRIQVDLSLKKFQISEGSNQIYLKKKIQIPEGSKWIYLLKNPNSRRVQAVGCQILQDWKNPWICVAKIPNFRWIRAAPGAGFGICWEFWRSRVWNVPEIPNSALLCP